MYGVHMGTYGFLWVCMGSYGFFMGMYGYLWVFMGKFGYIWVHRVCMGIYGLKNTFCKEFWATILLFWCSDFSVTYVS